MKLAPWRKGPPPWAEPGAPSEALAIRSLIATVDGRKLRVIDKLPGELVLYDVNSRKAQPQKLSCSDVDDYFNRGVWRRPGTPHDDAPAQLTTVNTAGEEDPRHAVRWKVVEGSIRDPDLYEKRTRGAALERIALKHECSTKFVRQVFALAWRGGMTYESVSLKLSQTGRRQANGKPWGRMPKRADYTPYAWPSDEFRGKVLAYATKRYSAKTFEDTYTDVLLKYFSYLTPENKRRQLPPGQAPTKRQIRYLLTTNLTEDAKSIRLKGKLNHDLNYDPRVGTVHSDCKGPGDVAEIDASQVDVWVLSRENGEVKVVIGKATMYLIVDRYSRLIIGFFCSLDPPSWTGALQAILSIFEDKKVLCERYGVPYVESDWIAHGLMPNRFFVDRGPEFLSRQSDYLTKELRLIVTNARALWAAAKGTVEVSHKLVNVELKRDEIGHDPAYNTNIRRARKTWKKASKTLPQVRTHLLEAVLSHNRRAHKNYQLPPPDIRDQKQPIPLDIYARGLRRYGRVSAFSVEEVRLALLVRSNYARPGRKSDASLSYDGGAAVHGDGVHFAGAIYTSTSIQEKGWLTRAKRSGSFRVDVRHDAGLVDFIYVFDPKDPKVYHRLQLTPAFKAFAGYSRFEMVDLVNTAKETTFWGDEEIQAARVARAAEREASKGRDKSQKVKLGTSEDRTLDKRADRSDVLALPPSPDDALKAAGPGHAPDLKVVPPAGPAATPTAATTAMPRPAAPKPLPAPAKSGIFDAASKRLLAMKGRGSERA